jgi:hypothetical protein
MRPWISHSGESIEAALRLDEKAFRELRLSGKAAFFQESRVR